MLIQCSAFILLCLGYIGNCVIIEPCYKGITLQKELLENDHLMVIFLKFLCKIPW